jgi:hypothetical protein
MHTIYALRSPWNDPRSWVTLSLTVPYLGALASCVWQIAQGMGRS